MPIDYQFTDPNVESGKTYFYYLGDIDITGKRSKSEIIKVVIPIAKPALPIPSSFALLQNYPNPFNPETWIPFELAKESNVILWIHNAKGSLVREIPLGRKPAGSYIQKSEAVHWDGKNGRGERVASGVYFYTLQGGDFTFTRKMNLVK